MNKMEGVQFVLFLKDHGLIAKNGGVMTKADADILFSSNNKKKCIDFEQFCEKLYKVALRKYPWEKN